MAELKGLKTTGGVSANEILVDYKNAIEDYKQTDLPVRALFCAEYKSETGGDVNITFAKESMTMQEIAEGSTPDYQHVDYTSISVTVKEYALRTGVTRIMLEDSRFDEIRNALNEARRAADRKVLAVILDLLKTGWYNADETPPSYGENTFDGTHDHIYTATGADGTLRLAAIPEAIRKINEHGFRADTMIINGAQLKELMDLASFTATAGVTSPVREQLLAAGSIGSVYGLDVIVNDWCPAGKMIVIDRASKPVAFVERRPLTVEEDIGSGFGIVGSFLSQRFGAKVRYKGAGVYVTL